MIQARYWWIEEGFAITVDKRHTVGQMVRALLANSKVRVR